MSPSPHHATISSGYNGFEVISTHFYDDILKKVIRYAIMCKNKLGGYIMFDNIGGKIKTLAKVV